MHGQNRFDRLLKAMSEGEPHKAEKRGKPAVDSTRQEGKETS